MTSEFDDHPRILPDSTALPSGPEPRQRLHPLSPLLHGIKSLTVIVAALSWQTLSRVGFGWFTAIVAVFTLGALVLSLVSWRYTGYHVVGRELRIYEGLVSRRTRAIPLERLQAVEVVQPLLARLTGLAELRLEVVGGGKTEAPLAYLALAEAVALRERLLRLAGQSRAAPVAGAERHGQALHVVSNQDLLVSQLLTPQTVSLPFGIAFVLVQFLDEGSWSFIAVASTLTAMAGIMFQPIRRVVDDWSFRLTRDEAGLRIQRGLVESRTQVVPLNRVQAVTATWPLLWRIAGWLRLRMDIAGYAEPAQAANAQPYLLPVGDQAAARRVVAEALPGVDLAALALTPPPKRARWLRPLSQPLLGAGLSDHAFVARHGLLTQRLTIVPYARIQSVRVVQGPLQRRLRLATVCADVAGTAGATARHRDLNEAWALAAELTVRARAARAG